LAAAGRVLSQPVWPPGSQVALPTGVTAEGDGIAIGETGVRIDAYIDFLCPFCRQFEAASGDALKQMVAEELIALVYHPLGFLDRLSTTAYSSRASAASGCASPRRAAPASAMSSSWPSALTLGSTSTASAHA
jgi:protein-disulfide isomerase